MLNYDFKYSIFVPLIFLFFILPVHIIIIGTDLGIAVQFPLFREQWTNYGFSDINWFTDIQYILKGALSGKTAISIGFWQIGNLFFVLTIIALALHLSEKISIKMATYSLFVTSCLYLTSIIIQYGPLFHGPAGVAIPVGLPLMFFLSYWFYSLHRKNREGCQEE